ncbi:MAG: hypothetical protein AAFR61_00270 [Bacteroidota bacterium]
MSKPTEVFQSLLTRFTESYPDTEEGNMMRAPAIKVKGKVFCFLYEEQMTFRLGRETDTDRVDLAGWRWLSPFKQKPPMKDWFIVPFQDAGQWERLAEEAWEAVAGQKK